MILLIGTDSWAASAQEEDSNEAITAQSLIDPGFIIAWRDNKGSSNFDLSARGFNVDGSQRFPDFTVNPATNGDQDRLDIAASASGGFVVVYEDDRDQNGATQIRATGYSADGKVRIAEFTVNSVAAGSQVIPVVAMGKNHQLFLPYHQRDIPF